MSQDKTVTKDSIILEKGWDPDKFRDELCEESWEKSGATTLEEYFQYVHEEIRLFRLEKRKAETIS